MTLTFDVTEDDFWAGQEHLMFKAPEMKRYFRTMLWFSLSMLFVLLPAFMLLTTPQRLWLPGLTGLAIGGGVSLLLVIVLMRYMTRLSRPLSRMFFRKVIDQAMGRHELELVPKGLHIRTAYGEQIVYWDSIGNIATTPEHTFIYLTRMQSVIVPQKRITGGNYHTFMKAFADVYAARRDSALEASPQTVNVPSTTPNVTMTMPEAEPLVQQLHS